MLRLVLGFAESAACVWWLSDRLNPEQCSIAGGVLLLTGLRLSPRAKKKKKLRICK